MTGRMTRLWRHFVTDRGVVHRHFSAEDLDRVERAIAAGETHHAGQVCFAVEAALPLASVWRRERPRARALEVFSHLRVWDTEANDGVLLYVLVADHAVEIVADRGIHALVGDAAWQTICHKIESAFRAGRFAEGVEQGIGEISALLAQHSPRAGPGRNEIADAPIVL
jgi:uncharacterized membrane protein